MMPLSIVPPLRQTTFSPNIGRYRLIADIGHGGMSDVYLAVIGGQGASEATSGFQKLLVIKILKPELTDEPDFVQMFFDEAKLAARLNHPNVVQTVEVGQDGQRYFIAMEYLDGQPLHRILQRSSETLKLSMSARLTILVRALAGLHYAHELTNYDGAPLNVVHRDVSPANLFVTYEGNIKLMDFGIAKALDSNVGTRIGIFKGKAGYIPPEQARGEQCDRRADIYAAGVVLWELITGRRMWRGLTQMETLRRVVAGEIPKPSSVEPRVPQELERICMKALAPNREDRYPTARALSADLEEFARQRFPLTNDHDVGRLIADGFVAERARMREIIDSQLSQPKQMGETIPEIDFLVESSVSASYQGISLTPSNSASRALNTMAKQNAPARSSAGRWVVAVLLGLGAVAGAAYLFIHRQPLSIETSRPANPNPINAAPTATPTPAATPIVTDNADAPASGRNQSARGISPTEIVLGMSAAFSGANREDGKNGKLGFELAFKAANDEGGIHGRKISLIALDDAYDAAKAGEVMKELLEKRGIFAFIGCTGAATAATIAPFAAKNKTIFFGSTSGSAVLRQDPPDRYVFNFRASDREEAQQAVRYLVETKKINPQNIVVFAQDDASGDYGFEGVVKAMRKYNRNDADIFKTTYKRNTADIDQALLAILKYDEKIEYIRSGTETRAVFKHPVKAIIVFGLHPAAVKLIQKARARNRLADTIFLLTSSANAESLAEELKSINPALCQNIVLTQVAPLSDSGSTGVLKYRDSMAKYEPQEKPGQRSLEAYIAGSIFVEGLKRAGPDLNSEVLVEALEGIKDLDLGFGTKIKFSMSEHQASHKIWGANLEKSCTYKPLELE